MHAITQLSIFAMLASEAWWPVIKNQCYLVCGEETNLIQLWLLWWNLLPSLFNTATSPQIHVQVCFMYIKDNERVKGCLYEVHPGWFSTVIVKYSLCPGGKSPISIGAHKMHWHLWQKGKLKDRYFNWNNCCERIS